MSNPFEDSPFLKRIGRTKDGIPSYRSLLTIPKSIEETLGTENSSDPHVHTNASLCMNRILSPKQEQR